MGVKTKKKKSKLTNKPPKWKVKIQKEISKGTDVKPRKARKVRNRNNVTDENSLLTAKETLKQRIKVKAQRLRRYDKRNRFYRQNKIFKTDPKKFYREIGTINIKEPPVDEEMTKFWNDIWGKEKDFNNEAEWIRREEERMNEVEEQEWKVRISRNYVVHLQSHINGNLLE